MRPGPVEQIAQTVGLIILTKASYRLSDEVVSAKTFSYLTALEDIPAWAVMKAWDRWQRGECTTVKDAERYRFAPEPSDLRAEAKFLLAVNRGVMLRLRRVLDAVPVDPVPDAEMEENAKALAKAIADAKLAADPQRSPSARPHTPEDAARDAETRAYWKQWLAENGPKAEDQGGEDAAQA